MPKKGPLKGRGSTIDKMRMLKATGTAWMPIAFDHLPFKSHLSVLSYSLLVYFITVMIFRGQKQLKSMWSSLEGQRLSEAVLSLDGFL